MEQEKPKRKIDYTSIGALVLFLGIVFVVFTVGISTPQKSPYEREFGGTTLHFRSNLDEAAKVPVYPSEKALNDTLINDSIRWLNTAKYRIAYIDNATEDPVYYAAAISLASHLTTINTLYYPSEDRKTVDLYPVKSVDEAYNSTYFKIPIFLLLGPSHANETSVTVRGDLSLIIIQGKDFSKTDRTYTDLELAADKLILVLMGNNAK